MNEVKNALVSNFDIFMCGIFLGGILVVLAQFVEKYMQLWLLKKQMQLDLTLGKALENMKERLK